MRVTVTRDKCGEIEIWNTDQPSDLFPVGSRYISKTFVFEEFGYVTGMPITLDEFKLFFGFTPRKGSKTVYVLTLDKLEK